MFKEKNTTYNITTCLYLNGALEEFFIRDLSLQQSSPASLNTAGIMMVDACLLGSIFLGSYFKYALYQHMYDNRKEIMSKPIDFLILIQALIDHFVCLFMTPLCPIRRICVGSAARAQAERNPTSMQWVEIRRERKLGRIKFRCSLAAFCFLSHRRYFFRAEGADLLFPRRVPGHPRIQLVFSP